ncbi:GNAT family N-acetyltransferase, partial [Vibrio vulnificus]
MRHSPLNAALYLIGENYMELVVPSQEFKSAFEAFYEDFAQNDVEN